MSMLSFLSFRGSSGPLKSTSTKFVTVMAVMRDEENNYMFMSL